MQNQTALYHQSVSQNLNQATEAEREKIILAWAKQHYQQYKDISTFPFDQYRHQSCRITAGVVYLCLRKHSFIKQNETTEYRVMDAYFRQNGRLADISQETGLTLWVVAKTVENLGYPPKWQEYRNSRYEGKPKLGLSAEALFKHFVPQALDMNEDIREGHPRYDFIVNEKTIDVKEFAPIYNTSRKNAAPFWLFRPFHTSEKDMADFYCLFLCQKQEERLQSEYRCLLIPKEALVINKQRYQISTNPKSKSYQYFMQFEVEPATLSLLLDE